MPRPVRCVTREMGLTHAEFFRLLPALLRQAEYRLVGDEVRVSNGDRSLVIELGRQVQRKLGALTLPTIRLVFRFHGYTDSEIDGFMVSFDRCFHRGGG